MGKVVKRPFFKVEDFGDHYHVVTSFDGKYEALEFLLDYLRCEVGGLENEKINEEK